MDLKTKLKRNKLLRAIREYFKPDLKERRQHYDSWVRRYKYNKTQISNGFILGGKNYDDTNWWFKVGK